MEGSNENLPVFPKNLTKNTIHALNKIRGGIRKKPSELRLHFTRLADFVEMGLVNRDGYGYTLTDAGEEYLRNLRPDLFEEK